jgi:hypothetical protein
MFVVTMRFAAGLAIGGAVGWWLGTRRTSLEPRGSADPAPERLSVYRADGDRRIDCAQIDEAVEDTFPASDPLSFTQALVVGPPPHRQAVNEEEADAATETIQR